MGWGVSGGGGASMSSRRPVWALGAAARRRGALGPCLFFERERASRVTATTGHFRGGGGGGGATGRARCRPTGPRGLARRGGLPPGEKTPQLAERPIRRAEPLRNAASSQPVFDSDR